jgi:hypothetical protein
MTEKSDETLPDKPQGDTSANEGRNGEPPPTWNPGKTTQPAPEPDEDE